MEPSEAWLVRIALDVDEARVVDSGCDGGDVLKQVVWPIGLKKKPRVKTVPRVRLKESLCNLFQNNLRYPW